MFRLPLNKKNILVLMLIVGIGIVLRFYQLGSVPIGFHKDEAFLGYNAYSILKTGKDINGNFLPLHLQSFLYSPAGYSYASIPFIWLFKLSAFSVRFASALFGSISVLLTYFLARQLFPLYKHRDFLGLSSAFLLAISPWHITLSRTATENTLVVFFITLGTLIYLKWLSGKQWIFLFLAFFSFGITLLIYQAPRAFLPLFIPLLVVSFGYAKNKIHTLIVPIALFLSIIVIPLALILFSKELSLRIKTVSIFATAGTQLVIDEQLHEDGVAGINPKVARMFHNKVNGYTQEILQNYFGHFSYRFFFTDTVFPKRYVIPSQGLLYIFELPFLLIGTWTLLKGHQKKSAFLFGWILLAPLGSALTFDDIPNLQRTLIFFPAITLVSAFGLTSMWVWIKKYSFYPLGVLLLVPFCLYTFIYFLHQYYVHSTHHVTIYRSEGYKELVSSVNQLLPAYKKAVITDRESSPTIFFLFYSRYDPAAFQFQTKKYKNRDFDRINFAKYEFTQEECPLKQKTLENGQIITRGEKKVLYVNSGLCKETIGAQVLATIKRPDNSTAFKILALSD